MKATSSTINMIQRVNRKQGEAVNSQSLPPARSFLQEKVYLLKVPHTPKRAPPTGDQVCIRHAPMRGIMHSRHHSLSMLGLVLTNVDFCVSLPLWQKSQLFFTEVNTKAEVGECHLMKDHG